MNCDITSALLRGNCKHTFDNIGFIDEEKLVLCPGDGVRAEELAG